MSTNDDSLRLYGATTPAQSDSPPLTTSGSKSAFGLFVAMKRREAGLTQRELAARVFVTESAVSKWERGLSYPDISLVAALAAELGVSEGELINAGDNHSVRLAQYQAEIYRRWRGAILWTTLIAYAVAVLTCFIVNLSVQHTLSWFWVVLPAIAVAFSLTTLPLLLPRGFGWAPLGAFLLSLFTLLGVAQLMYGGSFFAITVASLLFATIIVFLPFALARTPLPEPWSRHRTVLVLAIDTVAFLLFLFVILVQTGNLASFVPVAVPIAGISLVFVWMVALVIRYLPGSGLYAAAIVTALAGLFTWIANPLFEAITTREPVVFTAADLAVWTRDTVDENVSSIVLLSCLLVAVVLCVLALILGAARRR